MEFYLLRNLPGFVNVPRAKYIASRVRGDANETASAYQKALAVFCS